MFGSSSPEEVVIDFGVSHPEHWERYLTLKILRDGRIYFCDVTSLSDDQWKLDFAGKR